MIQPRERLWLTHRRRGADDFCPLCFAPIKWVYDGIDWIPCDKEPVLAYPGEGSKKAVISRNLRNDCWLYADGSLPGKIPVDALQPHIFTCQGLRR